MPSEETRARFTGLPPRHQEAVRLFAEGHALRRIAAAIDREDRAGRISEAQAWNLVHTGLRTFLGDNRYEEARSAGELRAVAHRFLESLDHDKDTEAAGS